MNAEDDAVDFLATCTCDLYSVLMVHGCQCGAMKREREAQEAPAEKAETEGETA